MVDWKSSPDPFKWEQDELEIEEMAQKDMEFNFHDLVITPKEGVVINLPEILRGIQDETSKHKPEYKKYDKSRLTIRIYKEEPASEDTTFFFGKMIFSQEAVQFRKETRGELSDLKLGESALVNENTGIIYFIIYASQKSNEHIVMLDNQSFAPGIGKMVEYIKDRIKSDLEDITHKQKLGKDLIKMLKELGKNEILLAQIRFRKNISLESIKKTGYVEDAVESMKKKNLDFELILRWDKKSKFKFIDFITEFFKIKDLSELEDTDFPEFLRKLDFRIDNTAVPHLNLMDRIFKFKLPRNKRYYEDKEDQLYEKMFEFFTENLTKLTEK